MVYIDIGPNCFQRDDKGRSKFRRLLKTFLVRCRDSAHCDFCLSTPCNKHTYLLTYLLTYLFTKSLSVRREKFGPFRSGKSRKSQPIHFKVVSQEKTHETDHDHSQLHWLPVRHRVEFKLACLVRQALCGQMPTYLADDIRLVSEGNRRSLRSSFDNMYAVPRTDNSFGDRSFEAAGQRIWNSLPRGLRTLDIS